jgi:uncharacterized membrane protein
MNNIPTVLKALLMIPIAGLITLIILEDTLRKDNPNSMYYLTCYHILIFFAIGITKLFEKI